MSLARMGLDAKALDLADRSSEMDQTLDAGFIRDPWSHRVRIVCDVLLEAGEAKRAAALVGGRREREFSPSTFVRVEHAVGRLASEADMAYLRRWSSVHGATPLGRRRLADIERRQAWLGGKGAESTEPVPTDSLPTDPEAEDRLWAAVLRENPG